MNTESTNQIDKIVLFTYFALSIGSIILSLFIYKIANIPSDIAWPIAIGFTAYFVLPISYAYTRCRNLKSAWRELLMYSEAYDGISIPKQKIGYSLFIIMVIAIDIYAAIQLLF